jgi:hypothetical protein
MPGFELPYQPIPRKAETHLMRPAVKLASRLELIVLLVLLLVMNLPLLTGATPIAWDTFKLAYEEFSISYGSVFFSGHLPLWLPFSVYGIPDYFWLSSVSIVSFLFIGVGRLLQVHNVLLLFKISLVCEQLIAVLGMYVLGTQIFRKRITVLLTCLAFMGTFLVYQQALLNFRLTYLLPLVLACIVAFFKRKSSLYLWLAGITLVLSVPGTAVYPVIIEFYGVAIFALVMVISDPEARKSVFSFSRWNLLTFCILIVTLLLFLYYFRTWNLGVEVTRAGRNADLTVPASTFLSLEARGPLALAASYMFGIVSYHITDAFEYVFYVGLLTLGGVIAAVLYERSAAFFAFLAAGAFLLAVSFGGYAALAAYELPFVSLSRYVTVLGAVPFRVFLIIGAGFGLDRDLGVSEWKRIGLWLLGMGLLIDVVGVTSASGAAQSANGYGEVLTAPQAYGLDFGIFVIRIAGYVLVALVLAWIGARKTTGGISSARQGAPPSLALLALLIFDLGLFRYNYEVKIQAYMASFMAQAQTLPTLQPLKYQDERLAMPSDPGMQQADVSTAAFQSIYGWTMESFLQFDRCVPDFVSRTGKFEIATASLMPLIDNGLVLGPGGNPRSALDQIFGCGNPKLRVTTNVLVAPTSADALAAIQNTTNLSNLLILSAKYSQQHTDLGNPPAAADIHVVSFSANQIRVDVDLRQEKAWLVYSDLYHPEWRATINGEPVQIERAYLAFKAVPLSQGANVVVLTYGSPIKEIAYTAIAVLGGAAALILLCALPAICLLESSAMEDDDRHLRPGPKDETKT